VRSQFYFSNPTSMSRFVGVSINFIPEEFSNGIAMRIRQNTQTAKWWLTLRQPSLSLPSARWIDTGKL
jgi:hypothetical protein